jgi:AcrR family transcriptional regulator
MREISREMGVSTGVLTHHFRNKDELLDFVFETLVEKLEARGHFGVFKTVDAFKEAFLDSQPSTEDTSRWWKVWLAYTTGAYSTPEHQQRQAKLSARIQSAWRSSLERLRAGGMLRGDIDIDREMTTLACLFEGMGIGIIYSSDLPSAKQQRAVLDAYFAHLLP